MKVTKQILFVAVIALVAVACKNTTYKKTKDGFVYKVYGDGKEKIMPGYMISFHTTSKIGDSLMGTSYGNPAQWQPIPTEGPELEDMRFFLDAAKGDSILLIRPIDSIVAKNPQAAQDSFIIKNRGKEIRTYIKIVDVYKDRESAMAVQEKEAIDNYFKQPEVAKQKAADDSVMQAYIKSNNVAVTRRSQMGVVTQVLKPGNGQKAKLGDYMMLRYTGKDFTGRVFDTNDKPGGQLMPMQVGAGGMIPGFSDGVKSMTKGEKSIILIPSLFAYGAQGNPQGGIAPNQNLLFEIEVVDISDKAPAPPSMPAPDTPRK